MQQQITPKRAGMVCLLLVVLAALTSAAASAAVDNPNCSIDGITKELGIDLAKVEGSVSEVVAAKVDVDSQERAPGSTIKAATIAIASSVSAPLVDGRRILVRQLADVPDVMISGPVGTENGPGEVKCAIELYDAETGEFLFSARRLQPRPK